MYLIPARTERLQTPETCGLCHATAPASVSEAPPSGVRDFTLGAVGPADLVNIGVLILFAVLMWRLAVWRLEARLID